LLTHWELCRQEFIDLVQRETGLNVRVLSGSEEAKCTFFGAVHALRGIPFPLINHSKNDLLNVVIDIGGGRFVKSIGQVLKTSNWTTNKR
jgi:exopolyphosphatase/pppGpp-phosphohydrolase